MAKPKNQQKKICVVLPANLLQKAQKYSGAGITATIKQGLELLAASEAYDSMRQLKGKVSLSLDLNKLREDYLNLRC